MNFIPKKQRKEILKRLSEEHTKRQEEINKELLEKMTNNEI